VRKDPNHDNPLEVAAMMTPDDRRYTKNHQWVKIEDDAAVVGITDYAQSELGDVTFLELPQIGETLGQGDQCGVIESVKASSDLSTPLSGQIVEVNDEIVASPEIVNEDPYEAGWLFKLGEFSEEELDSLLTAEQYDALTEAEEEAAADADDDDEDEDEEDESADDEE
jgi:glycine cleavage system H protein